MKQFTNKTKILSIHLQLITYFFQKKESKNLTNEKSHLIFVSEH